MANPDKGEFALSFKGESLTFKVGTGALIEAQEQIGRETNYVPTLEELLRDVLRQRLAYMRAFLWAGLRKYHAEKTIDDVTDLLDEMTQGEAVALLHGLTGSTQPDPKDLSVLTPKGGAKRPRKAQTEKDHATGDDDSTSPLAQSA